MLQSPVLPASKIWGNFGRCTQGNLDFLELYFSYLPKVLVRKLQVWSFWNCFRFWSYFQYLKNQISPRSILCSSFGLGGVPALGRPAPNCQSFGDSFVYLWISLGRCWHHLPACLCLYLGRFCLSSSPSWQGLWLQCEETKELICISKINWINQNIRKAINNKRPLPRRYGNTL